MNANTYLLSIIKKYSILKEERLRILSRVWALRMEIRKWNNKYIKEIITSGSFAKETVIKDSQAQVLRVRIYDVHAGTYNLETPATVVFKVWGGGEKTIGTNTTNASGSAEFYFNITACEIYTAALQNWSAEINSSETNSSVVGAIIKATEPSFFKVK